MRRKLRNVEVVCIAGLVSSDRLASEAAKYGGSHPCVATHSPSRAVSGRARWYDYHYYSRTAWWSTTCSSSSNHSESLEASPIWLTAPHPCSGQIDAYAESDRDAFNWSVTLTNDTARRFGLVNR
jgi:hypothetical protein